MNKDTEHVSKDERGEREKRYWKGNTQYTQTRKESGQMIKHVSIKIYKNVRPSSIILQLS